MKLKISIDTVGGGKSSYFQWKIIPSSLVIFMFLRHLSLGKVSITVLCASVGGLMPYLCIKYSYTFSHSFSSLGFFFLFCFFNVGKLLM